MEEAGNTGKHLAVYTKMRGMRQFVSKWSSYSVLI